MKKYFLGPNAANFLANQMRNQGASTEEPVLHRGRVSGSIIPFKITGDWEQRNGESVYSCVAREVFFDGTNYVTDQESLDFFLYSPIHLDDKPDNEVGDVVFAVLRGNNWEIIGGGGGGGTTGLIEVLTATPVAEDGIARVYARNDANVTYLAKAHRLPTTRSIAYGTPAIIATDLQNDGEYLFASAEVFDDREIGPLCSVDVQSDGVVLGDDVNAEEYPDFDCYVIYRYSYVSSVTYSRTNRGSKVNLPSYPCHIETAFNQLNSGFSSAGVFSEGVYVGSESLNFTFVNGEADPISITPSAGSYVGTRTVTLTLITGVRSNRDAYIIQYNTVDPNVEGYWRNYTGPIKISDIDIIGTGVTLYTRIRYRFRDIDATGGVFSKGDYINTSVTM